jgi:trimeric autotransporter adhesin
VGTQNATFMVSGVAVTGSQVVVNATGKLGVTASSARFKEGIKPMDEASEAILGLQPVTFRYKKELDPDGIAQFGLVAEDVEKVNPDLVVRDKEGKPYTVRYDAVNAMLLNEFLKEHRKNEQQEASITQLRKELQAMAAHQQKQIEALTAGIQEVSTQLELAKSAPQTALNNQ